MQVVHEATTERLDVRGRPLAIARLAAGVWTAGWLVLAASLISQAMRYGWSIVNVVVLTGWPLLGVIALAALGWAAAGHPERIRVNGQMLSVSRRLGPFGRTLRFEGGDIRALRVLPPAPPYLASYRAVCAFWDRGSGRVAFDVAGRTYAFGPHLSAALAESVIARIAAHLPSATVRPVEAEFDARRRLRPGWITHVTAWVMLAAVLTPVRVALGDLPICTHGAFGGDYYGLDVSGRDRTGRIVLAPFGDFPAGVARDVADHFATKYALDIVVAAPLALPAEAWDASRGQVESEVLLRTLERTYPEGAVRTVVIGLTNADMFNSSVNWRYAFSNRLPPRLAVVSPVRMDRGCLGFPAADATLLARLRKRVGQNIGVLFFRLPLSDHPRSMMYRSIGGPQELDTMLEEF